MDQNTLNRVKELLEKHNTIGIAVGKNQTLDSMGAALSLYLSLKASGKQVTIASPTNPLVEISNLVGIDKVKNAFDGEGKSLTVSFPYTGNNIEKGSYTVENGFLNIIVKAAEGGFDFDEKDIRYTKEGAAPSLLFIVGTSRLSDLGNLFNPEALKDTTLVNIDNNSQNQGFGDVVLVSSEFSSVAEQVGTLLSELKHEIDTDIAQNLLAGISFATNNFQDSKTSYRAFEMAALFMKKGAHRPLQTPTAPQTTTMKAPLDASSYLDDFDTQFDPFAKPFPQPPQPMSQPGNQQQSAPKQFPKQPFPFPKPAQQPQHKPQQPVQQFGNQQQNQQPVNPQPQQQNTDDTKQDDEAPSDWLMPKVYKGSTTI